MDVSVHEGGEIVDGVVDAVVRDASLRIVVGADFSGAVAGRHHCLASRRDVVNVFLMFFVVDDEEMKKARKTINDVIGLDKPNTGIMFALPVSFVEGLGA